MVVFVLFVGEFVCEPVAKFLEVLLLPLEGELCLFHLLFCGELVGFVFILELGGFVLEGAFFLCECGADVFAFFVHYYGVVFAEVVLRH